MATEPATILLVDDDPDFLDVVARILETRGYRVLCATSPGEGFERLAREQPGLVITDLMMSSLDSGFGLARRMKQDARFSRVPVIIVSAVGSQRGFDFRPKTPDELEAMSADAYFAKPVTPKELLAKVDQLLARTQQEEAGHEQ